MKAALIAGLCVALALPAMAGPTTPTGQIGPQRGGLPGPGSFTLPAQRPLGGARPATPSGFQGLPAHPPSPTDQIVARYSAVYEGCMRKAVSTLDMLECGGRETERWDARLNRAYQARMNSLNDRQRAALKRAEKAWLAFREADCAAYEDEEWGTISKIDAAQCTLRRTVERALELESFPADHGPG